MKVVIVVGLICLGVGYLAGSAKERGDALERNNVGEVAGGGDGGRGYRMERTKVELKQKSREEELVDIVKINGFEGVYDVFGWIWSLEVGDFPEAIELLGDLEKNQDEYSSDGGGTSIRQIYFAIGRWYELDPDAVLSWMRTEPKVLENRLPVGGIESMVSGVMMHGYHHDSDASFRSVIEQGERLRSLGKGWYVDREELLYAMGRWSNNLAGELEELLSEKNGGKFKTVNSDPIGLDEENFGEVGYLIRGLFREGRGEEAEALSNQLGGDFAAVLRILKSERELSSSENWTGIKDQIDKGELVVDDKQEELFFQRWVEHDKDAAIAWYLERAEQGAERSERIVKLVSSRGPFEMPYEEGGPWNGGGIDYEEVNQFLEKMAAQGESVEDGYVALSKWAMRKRDYDRIPNYYEKLGGEGRELFYKELRPELLETEGFKTSEGEMGVDPRCYPENGGGRETGA